MGTHSCVIFTHLKTNDKEIYTVLVGLICIYTCWDTTSLASLKGIFTLQLQR
jgi:hypothetical protein